jgi:hypothetical protein
MAILPPPPRVTSPGRVKKKIGGSIFIGILGLAMLGGMGWYAVSIFTGIVDDHDVFARGVPAAQSSVSGSERSRKLFFHEYDLTLTYTDKHGKSHSVHQSFDTAFGEVDEHARAEVRYDPKSPGVAVTSWSLDVTASRVVWGLLVAAIALVGGFLPYAAVRGGRDAFLERDAARDGREVRVRITEKSRDQYGNVTYELTAEVAPGDVVKGRATLNRKTPWTLGQGEALGVYSEQHRRVFLLESDGLPVVLDDRQLAEARARAAGVQSPEAV